MNTTALRVLTGSIALILTTRAFAVTDTWDGGGANNNFTTALNWADNTTPASSLANTDLIFGSGSLTPVVDVPFNAHSITFNNSFMFGGFSLSGQVLNLGTVGIANDGASGAGFDNQVNFSGVANSTIDAASGMLSFRNTVTLPTNTLTVTGSSATSFENISGTSTLNKMGSGEMTWTPNAPTACDVTVAAGTLTMGVDSVADLFTSGASIAVNGTSIFHINESLTLDGGDLTRASGASVILAAGKTLRVQGGGDVVMTGAYANTTDSTIVVTGPGSSFTGNSSLSFNGGSLLNVTAGGTVAGGASVNLGTAGSGTAIVTGSGSSLGGANFNVGSSGDSGLAIFSSDSTGTFATINVGTSATAGTDGTVSIQSGASVTATALVIANVAGDADGAVTITGAGSALTVTGTGITSIGAGVQNTGALNVSNSGTFNSGTGTTTVRATGSIVINGGTYNSNGNLTLNGGRLERLSGAFTLVAGTTFTIQSSGDAEFTGPFSNDTASSILVTGAGSTLSTAAAALSINGGSTLSAVLGAVVSTGGGALGVGTSGGNGTAVIADASSSVFAGALNVGQNGNTGSLTFSAGSIGTFTSIGVDNSGVAGTNGLLQIQSGADVTGTSLVLSGTNAANTGTVTITGTSSLTLSGAATATIGASGNSSGTLNVGTRGTFNSGTGLTTVNTTGTVAIIDSGTFNANGSVTLNGGQLTRDTGADFLLDAGRTFTVQNGGDATFTGAYSNGTASSIVVTGAGSTLSTTGNLAILGGSTLSVAAGGHVSSAAALSIGTTATGSTVTVSGAGSALIAASTTTIGAATGSPAPVNVGSGGTFTTGTGLTTVNATGSLNINAGGTLTGASDFAGTGTIAIAGTYLPGTAAGPDQTTSASFAQNMTLQATTSITMELGGLAAGTQHDQLVFNGPGATHITWNGTLNVTLIPGFTPQTGDVFNLFDFDAARDAGTFATVSLPKLPPGRFWHTDQLYTDGTIYVSSVPGSYAEWQAAFGTGAFNADDDGDGIPNGIEFVLGTNPKSNSGLGQSPLVELPPINAANVTARVTFTIPQLPATDAHYRLKASDDLVTWTLIASKDGAGPWNGSATVTSDPASGGFTPVTVAETLAASTAKRFHRLEAVAP